MRVQPSTVLALAGAMLASMMTVAFAAPALADETGQDRNLFETAVKKQTAADFKPAPDRIKTNFGSLQFDGGAFPTDESVQKVYDELDLQRATQAYMDFPRRCRSTASSGRRSATSASSPHPTSV